VTVSRVFLVVGLDSFGADCVPWVGDEVPLVVLAV